MADSTFKSILDATKRSLIHLNLPRIAPSSIVIHKAFTNNESTLLPALPGAVIVPLGPEQIDSRSSSNQHNAVSYLVGVGLFASDADHNSDYHEIQNQEADLDRRLKWRETVRRHFHMRRLKGVDEVEQCFVRPNAVLDVQQWLRRGIWISAFTLEFEARESRLANA